MMKIQMIITGFCLLLISSCSWLTGISKLGDRIYRDEDIIVFTGTDDYKGIGKLVVPPKIKKVNTDDKFVIVMTLNGKNKTKYWLIDKTEASVFISDLPEDSLYWGYSKYSNVYGPLDSIEFVKLKQQKGVQLDW